MGVEGSQAADVAYRTLTILDTLLTIGYLKGDCDMLDFKGANM